MTEVEDVRLRPFRVDVSEDELVDLRGRLGRVRWPEEWGGPGWAYGVPGEYLRELVRYWRDEYDWRAAEERLNLWPQFTTVVDGARVHFAHVRSPEPGARALLMTHGWPGSIVEFSEVVGPLTDPVRFGGEARDAFHVVLPSIPGFGLSGPTPGAGWEFRRVATAFAEVMRRLGYREYGVQGGDWGAAISRELGRIRPDEVSGVHLNLLPGGGAMREPDAGELAGLDEPERERTLASWRRQAAWDADSAGYAVVQATRPRTLSYGLTDSPVGQLAWIAEKFREWADPGCVIDRDLLLTNVMLYWLTRTAGSSAAIYYERAHTDYGGDMYPVSRTPTALAVFPHDNFIPLRHVAERTNNIVRWTEFERGGHFPALEVPEVVVGDVREFFRAIRR